MRLSLGHKLLICASFLVSEVVAKGGSTVRSELKVEVDEKGVPHTQTAPRSDQKHADGAVAVEVNDHGDIVNLGNVGTESAIETHSSGANEKVKAAEQQNSTTQDDTDEASSEHKDAVHLADVYAATAADAALDEVEAITFTKPAETESYIWRRRRRTAGTPAPPPAVNCEWGEWKDGKKRGGGTSNGRCSTTCGPGIKTQRRKERREAEYGGRDCVGEREHVVECNVDNECPTTTTLPIGWGQPGMGPDGMVKNAGKSLIGSVPWLGSLALLLHYAPL